MLGQPPDHDIDAFVVDHNRSTSSATSGAFPLAVLFAIVTLVMLHPRIRTSAVDDSPTGYWIMVGIFGVLAAIAFVEGLMAIVRNRSGSHALVIDRRGIRGLHAHRQRAMSWDEVGEIYVQLGNLTIARRPVSLWEKASHAIAPPGSRYRREVAVVTRLGTIDADEAEIEAAIKRFAPPGSRFADPSWRIGHRSYLAFEKH